MYILVIHILSPVGCVIAFSDIVDVDRSKPTSAADRWCGIASWVTIQTLAAVPPQGFCLLLTLLHVTTVVVLSKWHCHLRTC